MRVDSQHETDAEFDNSHQKLLFGVVRSRFPDRNELRRLLEKLKRIREEFKSRNKNGI
jgi:hypothetical protein